MNRPAVESLLAKEALAAIASFHEAWSQAFPFACRRGCRSCCTQSVTMTELEGTVLRDYLAQKGRTGRLAALPRPPAGEARPRFTTNQFAAACLQGLETEGEPAGWNLAPCPFLEGDACSIYPVRPFGCRAFASLTPCDHSGEAEVPPLVITINTIFLQLIEHLDQGGAWGNMLDLLAAEPGPGSREEHEKPPHLLVSHPCPGLLVPPGEEEEVARLLAALGQTPVADTTLGTLLGMAKKRP